jgi:hypothetical protein
MLTMKDLCYRGQGFLGQHGKETKTSWDTLSYTLVQAHNVYQHIYAVQEANRRYEQGIMPKMIMNKFEDSHFGSIVDEIFSMKDRKKSLDLIDKHSKFWMQMQSGSQGFSGKKTVNTITSLSNNFEGDMDKDPTLEKIKREILDADPEVLDTTFNGISKSESNKKIKVVSVKKETPSVNSDVLNNLFGIG